MSRRCACSPGSEANGWHEIRCAKCVEIEKQSWWDMLARWRESDLRRSLRGDR